MSNQVSKLDQVTLFKNQLWNSRSQFAAALPAHVPADRFVRMAMTVISQQPELLQNDRLSLQSQMMTAASMGLMLESFMGEAYLIPYKGKVTLQIGYKGLLKLARNTGEIASIESGVIHENDEFSFQEGDDGHFWVKPRLVGDRGAPLAAWCVIRLKSGETQREVIPAAEVEKIRLGSNSANSPAWKAHWGSMARKVVIKRALKYAPSSSELLQAIAIDDAPDSGVTITQGEAGEVKVEPAKALPEPVKREKTASSKQLDQLAETHMQAHVRSARDEEEPAPKAVSFHDDDEAEEAEFDVAVQKPPG